jgi:MbeD/MobD like
MKLGDATVDALKNTPLGSAKELDELVVLNRGAAEGTQTPIVKQLVADAVAGKDVSAIATKNGAIDSLQNHGPRNHGPTRADIGAASAGEIARKDAEIDDHAEIDDLRNAKRQLEIKIAALEAKIEDQAKTIDEFQNSYSKWQETFEVLQNENAKLRAGVAASEQPGEPQTLAQLFNRAVDVLALLDGAISEGPAALWPEKVKSRDRNRSINEVHHFLARLRGFRDVVELHSGVSDEEPPPDDESRLSENPVAQT